MRTRQCLVCFAIALAFSLSSQAVAVVHPVAAQILRQSADKVELLSGELSLPVSLRCPSFAFNTAVVGGAQMPSQISGSLLADEELVAQYAPLSVGETAILEVKLHLTWNAQEGVLRKWAEYRLNPAPAGCVLHEMLS